MRTHTNEEREESYSKLPEVLKEALYDPDIANTIFDIGKKYELTIEQIGFLAEEAGTLVLGLTRPDEFVSTIQERLGVDSNKASNIAKEINSQIFYPLREALKAAHQMEIAEEEIAKTETKIPEAGIRKQELGVAPPSPQTKAEIVPTPKPMSPPAFTKPPEQERKLVPPIDLRPKPAPSPEQKFLDKFVSQKTAPPLPSPAQISKEILAGKPSLPKPPEPIRPPAPIKPPQPAAPPPSLKATEGKAKIPPLDLRRSTPPPHKATAGKPERMREAIFAPPIEPQAPAAQKEPPAVTKPPAAEPKLPERKAPYGGYDPYKEPVD